MQYNDLSAHWQPNFIISGVMAQQGLGMGLSMAQMGSHKHLANPSGP